MRFIEKLHLGEWRLYAVLECGHERLANYGHSKRLRCGDCPRAFSTDGLHGVAGRDAQARVLRRRKKGQPIFGQLKKCPIRSSISEQPCLLYEGHPPDSATRFHKYAPPKKKGVTRG